MNEYPDMSCAQLDAVAAELALGVLTGRERAEAVAHLDRCDNCREHVRQLMVTTEGLLGLLPEREPPAGFETRVLDRLGLSAPGPLGVVPRGTGPAPAALGPRLAGPEPRGSVPGPRSSGRPPGRPGSAGRHGQRGPVGRPSFSKRTLAAAAVALAIVCAGLGGWGMGVSMSPRPAPVTAEAPLSSANFVTAQHQSVGQVFMYQGSPRWLYMWVELPSSSGMVTCQVIGADGRASTVGSFRLNGGYGSWGVPDQGNFGAVRGARLLAPDGTVLARASFS